MKSLSALRNGINILEIINDSNPEITGIAYDSRRVASGYLFAAFDGVHTDGHEFISKAIELGARAIHHSKPVPFFVQGVTYLRVDDCRKALSALSSAFYNNPSNKLVVIGVTGTDGKSSTVWFIHQLLTASGFSSGFLSTVEFMPGAAVMSNPYRQSTPEAPEVHSLLAEMTENGKQFAVIEATSHGLSNKTSRLHDVLFDVAVYTNITHEHLEFHGTIEQYRHDKANLFRTLDRTAAINGKNITQIPGNVTPFGVVNADDSHCAYIMSSTRRRLFRYSLCDTSADLYARITASDLSGSDVIITWNGMEYPAKVPLPGTYNVENILATFLAVTGSTGIPIPELIPHLKSIRPAKGRMNHIKAGQPFSVIVDYAHTPGSFERVLPFARGYTKGKLTAVFGSGGERDRGKRPVQGRIASVYCDRIILSDEDPRLEDRMSILEEIARGCDTVSRPVELHLIPDRREAIRTALAHAEPDDTVLLLGKGHESSIIQADGPHPWEEAAVAREILSELGFSDTGASS